MSTLSSTLWWILVILLVTGLYWLVLRVFSVRNFFRPDTWRNATPEARQLAYLFGAFVELLAGGLWIVAVVTAQFTFLGAEIFLIIGVMHLIRALLIKPGQKS